MSEWNEPEVVDGALIASFRGYVSRVTPSAEFVTAIQTVVEGGTVFSNTLTDDDPEMSPDMSERLSALTDEERGILERLVEGADTRTIARQLGIPSTELMDRVKTILEKLDPRRLEE
jgi:two-component system nitrate/nitrite response regulator NarL